MHNVIGKVDIIITSFLVKNAREEQESLEIIIYCLSVISLNLL